MKSFLRIILLTVTMATFCVSTYAQKSDRQRMTREQLAEFQAEYIAKELEMDDMTTQQFTRPSANSRKIFGRSVLVPRKIFQLVRTKKQNQAIKERFAHSQKILNLRQKYYEEYSKFLSQKQIGRVYELERKMMDHLFHRSQKEKSQKK